MKKRTVALGSHWTLEDLHDIAFARAEVSFPDDARERVRKARRFVENLTNQGESARNVYGVNTGFGALAETRISAGDIRVLQLNLIRSHACGVGPEFPAEVARAMVALRAQVLSFGCSGAREETVELLLSLLKHNIVPCIPSQGSVGASGDLAPLAHLALVLIGEGEATYNGARLSGGEALRQAGLAPICLEAKEGLALINGTQMMLAVGGLALVAAQNLVDTADVTGSMTVEAMLGSRRPFDPRIAAVRPHPGQAKSAQRLHRLLDDSEIMASHASCKKVQDAYSLRCMPQVHGTTRDVLDFARQVLERELIAVTDNPLIFVDGDDADVISGGNFHGQPLAVALDAACIAVSELANISERRMEQMVNPSLSGGLPPFLGARAGLDSGFMIAHVTATALVSENKVLCHPSSADSIPSSAGKEDHVSMGSISARKFAQVVEHVTRVLGIEAMIAAQGIDYRGAKPGLGVRSAQQRLRQDIAPLNEDRVLYPDLEAAFVLVKSGALRQAAEQACGL